MDCANSNSKNNRRNIMTNQELTYWVTLALMPKIWTKRKNEIYVNCFNHNPRISIIELFENSSFWNELGLTETEIEIFKDAHDQLANNSFVVEDLLSQGYDILPIHSSDYPRALKNNLKSGAPTVIFTKGDKRLLQEQSIAIVGSRNANDVSLHFTDNVAKMASSSNKVVVSGFAKGVDKQALNSALENNGKSIIVLPQGIMTFSSGFKQYYKYIAQGKVLVMSAFAPKAPWSKEYAMARNPIIYGMASDIFVAQSDEKGGTWSGVIDGLRKKRTIYVRWPNNNEMNANKILIQKGASSVDINGNIYNPSIEDLKTDEQRNLERINSKLISILSSGRLLSLKEILSKLDIEWSDAKMKKHLESMSEIEKSKIKNRVYYSLKGGQSDMFVFKFE